MSHVAAGLRQDQRVAAKYEPTSADTTSAQTMSTSSIPAGCPRPRVSKRELARIYGLFTCHGRIGTSGR